MLHLPEASRSCVTRPDRSGSSPYQKIHSSLLECSDRAAVGSGGGGAGWGGNSWGGGGWRWKPPPRAACIGSSALRKALAEVGIAEAGGGRGACTRRHTHRMSAARHLENDAKTGSSRGSVEYDVSVHSNLRHLMPHRSVCNNKAILVTCLSQKCVLGCIYIVAWIRNINLDLIVLSLQYNNNKQAIFSRRE